MTEYRIFGSPGCIVGNTKLRIKVGDNTTKTISVKAAHRDFPYKKNDYKTFSLTENGLQFNVIESIVYKGIRSVFRYTTNTDKFIELTGDHPIKIPEKSHKHIDNEGFVEAQYLSIGDTVICKNCVDNAHVHTETIKNIESIGEEETYDLIMRDPYRNFVAHGFILHNCGKTHYLVNNIIPQMKAQYGEDKIMITSFTKTAAVEIARRAGLKEDDPKYGTLHSICYQAMKRPKLVDTVLKEWNDLYPSWKMTKGSNDGLEFMKDKNESNIIEQYQMFRNRLIPIQSYPRELQDFHEMWTKFKMQRNVVDFTDMIEIGLHEYPSPPFAPSVIIVDESQDFTPLQIKLIRSWGITVPKVFLCLDDDQAIFSFQGVEIDKILFPDIEPENKIFLQQSYRVPRKPQAFANQITKMISFREDKTYYPTNREGDVLIGEGTIDDPRWCIDKAISSEGTSMIMTSCAYMLQNITAILKTDGIPFYNPYKTEDKRWNPLSNKATKILYNFLSEGEDAPYWDTKQLLTWIENIKTTDKTHFSLIRGKANKLIKILKDELAKGTEGLHTCREYLSDLLSPEAIQPALNRDITWLKSVLTSEAVKTIDYPLSILQKHSLDKEILNQTPKIIVGTIHSFKGTEADNVFVFPDISWSAKQQFDDSVKGKDDLHRLFYVAVTRTKNNLYLMPPAFSSMSKCYSSNKYYEFPSI